MKAQIFQSLFEHREIRLGEIESVECPVPVRRVEIEERLRTIIPLEDFFIRQTFDLYSRESLVGFFDQSREVRRIEVGRLDDGVTVILVANQASVRILLQVEETRGSLDIGQCFGHLRLQKLKPLAADEAESQIPNEFLMVRLADTEEIHDFAVHVVQHLNC